MVDWVDSYLITQLDSATVERLYDDHAKGLVSRNYLLGLFNLSDEAFDEAVHVRRLQRQKRQVPKTLLSRRMWEDILSYGLSDEEWLKSG